MTVEHAGFGLFLVQQARREGLPIHELIADTDKVSRALPAAARAESGGIYLLENAPWREEFERELLSFPSGAHDDMVDCLAYAITQTAQGIGAAWIQYMKRLVDEQPASAPTHRAWSTDSPPARPEVAAP